VVSTAVFSPGNGLMFLDEVQCSGVVNRLLECAHMGFGNQFVARLLFDVATILIVVVKVLYQKGHLLISFLVSRELPRWRGAFTGWNCTFKWQSGGVSEWNMEFSLH